MGLDSLLSDYIIVTNLAQTGTSVEGQKVISVPNNEIINGTFIGKAYKKVSDEYVLKDNAKHIYLKKQEDLLKKKLMNF